MPKRYFRTRTAAHTRYFRAGHQFGLSPIAVEGDALAVIEADPHLVEVDEPADVAEEAAPKAPAKPKELEAPKVAPKAPAKAASKSTKAKA